MLRCNPVNLHLRCQVDAQHRPHVQKINIRTGARGAGFPNPLNVPPHQHVRESALHGGDSHDLPGGLSLCQPHCDALTEAVGSDKYSGRVVQLVEEEVIPILPARHSVCHSPLVAEHQDLLLSILGVDQHCRARVKVKTSMAAKARGPQQRAVGSQPGDEGVLRAEPGPLVQHVVPLAEQQPAAVGQRREAERFVRVGSLRGPSRRAECDGPLCLTRARFEGVHARALGAERLREHRHRGTPSRAEDVDVAVPVVAAHFRHPLHLALCQAEQHKAIAA
mmetsp:Transcript_116300/g.323990  ORF Transcript_116300/g.323990 Transcript_116300/m.323990 type:complete len:278 (+) Transcript_116300:655-1488(+)